MDKIARNNQSGAVSLFAVIFATLLLTVLMLGFMRLIMVDQRQALNNELSQSAYDAALSGVEDAKRVVRACQKGDNGGKACEQLRLPNDCKVVARAGVAGNVVANETLIQSRRSGDGKEFNQAYTCVNITMDTEDFLVSIPEGSSRLVPLKAKAEFNKIVLEWFTKEDANGNMAAGRVKNAASASTSLPAYSDWDESPSRPAPALLRTQMIFPGDTFDLASLDSSRVATMFLYPRTLSVLGPTNGGVSAINLPRAGGGGQFNNAPTPVSCSPDFANSGYSCRVTIDISPVTVAASVNSFLRLTPLYRMSHVRIALYNGAEPVKFDGVQPAVDATGRASNVFRRVEARLQIGDDFPYPENAIDLENSLCKDFSVTEGSVTPGNCRP